MKNLSIGDLAEKFFPDEPEPQHEPPKPTPDPVPAGAATAPSAPEAAATGAPPASPSPSRKVRLKEDDIETELDIDEYVSDEAKRNELTKWLQLGRQHEKLVDRRTSKEREVVTDWFLKNLRANGYDLVYDPATDKTTVRTLAPNSPYGNAIPNTNGTTQGRDEAGRFTPSQAPAASAPANEINQLEAEIEKLEKKVEEDGDAKDVVALSRLNRKLSEARAREVARGETSSVAKRLEQTESERRAEQLARMRETALGVAGDVFKRHAALFDRYDEAERQALMAQAAQNTQTMDEFRNKLELFAQREMRRFGLSAVTPNGGTAAAAVKPAAPPPPPVHNGASPAAAGAPAPKPKRSTLEPGWEKDFFPDE